MLLEIISEKQPGYVGVHLVSKYYKHKEKAIQRQQTI
jgi:hypothetical protein